MRSFEEQAAFGLPHERVIAQTAALLLFPSEPGLELVRLPEHAYADFAVMNNNRILAMLEVKRRAVSSTTYSTTILPQTVVDLATRMAAVGIDTYAAILFSDGLYIFDVLRTPSKVRYLRARSGRLRKHREYPIRNVLRAYAV